MIATVLARTWATDPKNCVRLNGSPCGLAGTVTTLPGPGAGDELTS